MNRRTKLSAAERAVEEIRSIRRSTWSRKGETPSARLRRLMSADAGREHSRPAKRTSKKRGAKRAA